MENILEYVIPILVIIFFLAFFGMAIRWCTDDANSRGKSPVVVCCAVILFFPWGWLAWLAFRPDVIERRPFDLNRYRK